MRIIKEHGERKAEIIDAAEALFLTKGYANSSINDILVALNIMVHFTTILRQKKRCWMR